MNAMPTSEDWQKHIAAKSNFTYFARSVKEAWIDPHTGGILYQLNNWGGFWCLMGVSGTSGHVSFLPPGAKRIIHEGQPVFESDDEYIAEAWKQHRRSELTKAAEGNWRAPSFYGSDEYRKLQATLQREGLA